MEDDDAHFEMELDDAVVPTAPLQDPLTATEPCPAPAAAPDEQGSLQASDCPTDVTACPNNNGEVDCCPPEAAPPAKKMAVNYHFNKATQETCVMCVVDREYDRTTDICGLYDNRSMERSNTVSTG
jgi:hypothetical protein